MRKRVVVTVDGPSGAVDNEVKHILNDLHVAPESATNIMMDPKQGYKLTMDVCESVVSVKEDK